MPEPIEVKLFGPDLAELQKWAPRVAKLLEQISGVVEQGADARILLAEAH